MDRQTIKMATGEESERVNPLNNFQSRHFILLGRSRHKSYHVYQSAPTGGSQESTGLSCDLVIEINMLIQTSAI